MQKKFETKHETFNFFPFTHGDKIEDRRAIQKKQARLELKHKLMKRARVSKQERGRRSIIYKNVTPVLDKDDSIPNLNSKAKVKDVLNSESITRRVPVKYMTAYPTFMKPAKHHPYRRLNDTHIETTMQDAIKRVEADIKHKSNDNCNTLHLHYTISIV